jgi:hypothetical protein
LTCVFWAKNEEKKKRRLFQDGSYQASSGRHLAIYQDLHGFVHEARHILSLGVHWMASEQIPISIQRKSCSILETLSNLLYLAEMEADDPQKVRTYLSLSNERVQAMIQLLIGRGDPEKQQGSFGGDSLRQ